MNVERSLFLVLVTSLAGAACAAPTADEAEAASQMQSAGEPRRELTPEEEIAGDDVEAAAFCWNPATESIAGPSQESYVDELGFDPLTNAFVEKFCLQVGAPGTEHDAKIVERCMDYSRLYVPFTTLRAFSAMKRNIVDKQLPLAQVPAALASINFGIEGEHVCVDPDVERRCDGAKDPVGCEIVGSQVRPEHREIFVSCIGEGFTAVHCLNGSFGEMVHDRAR